MNVFDPLHDRSRIAVCYFYLAVLCDNHYIHYLFFLIVLENKCLFLGEMWTYVFNFKETDMLTSQAAEPWMPTSTPSLFCEQQKILDTIDPFSQSPDQTP